ncbi:MAG: class I SAM-dependent methyltransferase [Lachnospiraceae bacterium]|nr:class I SAM-dependent methyltransferase [Lachnospiraceae bacterium]
MGNSYLEALKFWNQAFDLDEEAKEQYRKELNPENYKELASSEKLADVLVEELAGKKRVLDYGCGEGWAGILLNKSGCKDVTSVDVVENAIKLAEFLKSIYDIKDGLKMECVPDTWLDSVEPGTYDGIFCSNVIDVLPAEVTESILANFARVATDDAKIVIGMNYYFEPVSKPDKGIEVRNGNEMYVNGVLRMVTRTDDEWREILGRYFTVEKVEYFAWPGETEEKRRIFVLKR